MPVLAFVLAALAADTQPKQKPIAAEKDEAALEQERLSRQFREFEASLLRLAQRLERSSKPEDRNRAVTLKAAIKKASEVGIDTRFETLIGLLRNSNSVDYAEMKEAMEQSKILANDIRTVLDLLTNDNDAARLKAEKEHIQKMLEMLEKVIREQKIVRAQTEGRLTEKGTLSKAQEKVLKSTQDIAKAMKDKDAKGSDRKGENKDEKGKGDNKGQNKDEKGQGENKGQNKDANKGEKSKGDNKQQKGEKQSKGQGKSEGKSKGEGKEGGQEKGQEQEQNQDQQQQQQQQLPGQKQVQDATRDQNNAQKNIDKDKNDEASKNQDDAIKKLEEVRRQWEELLRQLREEEMKRLLEALQSRCQRMLALQLEVYDGTVHVAKDIAESPDKKASRAEEQRSLQLSDREQQIVGIASQAIQLLETEGSAVAFPEAFHQVKEDATQVTRRLGKADVGTVTQVTEQDIIATLKEMIEALEKAKQELQNRQQNQPQQQQQSAQQGNQPLIDRIAELKMIRSMQIRVNERTLTYAKQYPGEQANDPDVQKELSNLAQRQQKIFTITNNIARGKNK
jgi:hypothetical protein